MDGSRSDHFLVTHVGATSGPQSFWPRQVKQFRREGKQRRRQVLLDQLSQAQQAANSFSQGKLYRVIRQMAKAKREKVQIRSETGALMTVKEEFREIAGHCRQVFGQGAPKQRRALSEPLQLEVNEVKLAITQLQARKGVPRSSFPTTIWKACAGSLAERLCRVANSHWGQCDLWVPGEWADCELLMIPKPGKGREVLDLGLPGKPLLIPKVQQMTLKVAAMNRQRLQKILHSSRVLSVRHRLRLNMAMEDVASVAQQEMLDIFPASAGHSKQGRREEDKDTEQPAKFSKQREKGGQGKGQWNRSWGSGGLVQSQGPTVLGNRGGGHGACQAAGQSGSQAGGRQREASSGKRVYPIFRHRSTRHFADAPGSLPELEGQEGGGKSNDIPPSGPAALRAPGASDEATECAGGRDGSGSGHQAWLAEGRRGGPGPGLDFHEVGSGNPDPTGVGGDSHEALQASGPCGSATPGVSAGKRLAALSLDQAHVRHLSVPSASLSDELGDSLHRRGPGLRCVVGPDRVLGATNDWASPPQGTPGQAAASEGVDYHLPELQHMRLEEEGGAHPEASSSSWERGGQGSVIEEPPRRAPTPRVWLCTEDAYACLPTAVLSNTSNVCYMNAAAHCIYWSGICGPNPSQAYGTASGCLRLLRSSKPQLLHRTLSWRNLLRDWAEVTIQHDAAEFFAYLVARAVPVAWDGEWQSRELRRAVVHVLDRGSTFQPVLVPLAGDSLQSCWDSWERQAAIHALWRSGGLLLMQLGRYREAGTSVLKDTRTISVQPGQTVAVPFFDHEEGTMQCSMQPFRVLFVIYHLGNTLTSGHYKAALSTPPSLTGTSQWKFLVCDDNRPPQRASATDLQEIQHNVYLVGLLKLSVSN
ncbi:SPBC119.03 [Symbiodinium necroappetens]|uniref:SPBC119.03 protein n=1 Tax=Symbiodinium necroappetens TaxID=1628268 RepID=A0A812JML3_9DINO|nr:SPBC119.03 [Symbiodinium necroappetens]